MRRRVGKSLIERRGGLNRVLTTYRSRDRRVEKFLEKLRGDRVITDERTFSGRNGQILPEEYDFGAHGFLQLVAHIRTQTCGANQSGYTVCPLIATYANQAQRTAVITNAVPADRAQCKAGAAISTTVKYFPSKTGGIGIICSPIGETDLHESEWHAVAMLRKRKTIWIFDPAYVTNSKARLSDIPGTVNIINLINLKAFAKVEMIQIQGVGSMDEDCMGRSAQWVDSVLATSTKTQPYPCGTFVPGVLTHGWQEISI